MTSQLLQRLDLSKLYPPFRAKIEALAQALEARKDLYWAVSGLRSFDEQREVYAQGRTKPCSQCAANGITAVCKHIISKAMPGSSPHNYGIAVDFCHDASIDKPGLQPDWDAKNYKVLGEETIKVGLESGYFWQKFPDAPHIQLPISKYKITFMKLLSIYQQQNIAGVWQFLDQYKW